jgi:outer membrane protein assembly factor BamB
VYGIGPGGPAAVVAAVALTAGWVVIAIAAWRPVATPARRVAVAAVGAALAVLAMVAGAGVPVLRWYAESRFVDSRTVPASTGGTAAAAADFGRQRWRSTVEAPLWSGVSRHHLVLRYGDGVRALDPATGRPRWHYLRRDLSTGAAAVSADGSTVVVVFGTLFSRRLLAVGLDEATGAPRWRRWHRLPERPWLGRLGIVVAAGDVVAVAGTDIFMSASPVAFDTRTGALRWGSVELVSDRRCFTHDLAAVGQVVAVAMRCHDDARKRADTRVIGLSTVDGRPVWTWRQEYDQANVVDGPTHLFGSAGTFVASYTTAVPGTRGDRWTEVSIAADTGTELAHTPGRAGYPVPAGDAALYLGPGDLATAVRLTTAAPVWERHLPPLSAGTTVSATARDGVGVAVLRAGPPPAWDGDPAGAPLRLIAVDLATGALRTDRPLAVPAVTCDRLAKPARHSVALQLSRGLPCADDNVVVHLVGGVAVVVARARHGSPTADVVALG